LEDYRLGESIEKDILSLLIFDRKNLKRQIFLYGNILEHKYSEEYYHIYGSEHAKKYRLLEKWIKRKPVKLMMCEMFRFRMLNIMGILDKTITGEVYIDGQPLVIFLIKLLILFENIKLTFDKNKNRGYNYFNKLN